MKKTLTIKILCLLLGTLFTTACSDDDMFGSAKPGSGGEIHLASDIEQVAMTRVNDQGFADGDMIGVYIVDYKGTVPGTLLGNGNNADNVRLTFDEANNKWNAAKNLYWKDKVTHIDVYGYYPYATPNTIEEYAFTVQRDQSRPTENGTMGGYEASDFLWGKATDIAPTSSTIHLSMEHRMSNLRVTLTEGTGFNSGEWEALEKNVLAANLIRKAKIDLRNGKVTPDGNIESTTTIPSHIDNEWRAIVVPQTVAAGTTLFSITIGGKPYKFAKNADFTYVEKMMMNFTIRIDKKGNNGQYALSLVSESISPWENDLVSHDGTAKEYLVITSQQGHFADSIKAHFKDYANIKNLKIKGEMNGKDFAFICSDMNGLQALNLKETRVYNRESPGVFPETNIKRINDYMPYSALYGHEGLQRIILPDSLKGIANFAFYNCPNLTGSLTIPEGVKEIYDGAFAECSSLNGVLTLPNTLEKIDARVFDRCQFNCELILPQSLKFLGSCAFQSCEGLYGNLTLPNNLESIESATFSSCSRLTGDLVIPDKVKDIKEGAFNCTNFNGTLTLPEGLNTIGENAFGFNSFKGELNLPKSLTAIKARAFVANGFSGTLKLPEDLVILGVGAFDRCHNLTGTVEIPEGIEVIPQNAFYECSGITSIILPENLNTISANSFNACYNLRTIVSRSQEPPRIDNTSFNGVSLQEVTLEVPEAALNSYKTANVWRDFKNITVHHELACSPQTYDILNKKSTHSMNVRAEGEWEVLSKPDWCTLSKNSGSGNAELQVTIEQLAKGSGDRNGEIVLKLKDKPYTYKVAVQQHDFKYDSDEFLTLQKATRGNNGGINIVLLGDGYTATEIKNGDYLNDINNAMTYFFGIEPYTTYRDYFNVYTAITPSTESGISTTNTKIDNRFATIATASKEIACDYNSVIKYAQNAPTVNESNIQQTLVILIPNTNEYHGRTYIWEDGSTIAICPKSKEEYPYDTRGFVQHEAGGHGFGKLADEMIMHSSYIDMCNCTCCSHDNTIKYAQSFGWYKNISLTGKAQSVPWSHLLSDSRYNDIVDIYEGAAMHSKGVFRSEPTSCMSKYIPYHNTISRELIVRRIKEYAGEAFSFEDFVAHDKRNAVSQTRGVARNMAVSSNKTHSHPTIIKGSPTRKRVR